MSKTKKKRGRPPKITLEVVEEIGKRIAKGMSEEQACLLLDISYVSFKKAEQRHPEFVLAIKKAQAKFLDDALDSIAFGSPGWQGSAWILERRHKPQFNRTETHALTDPNGTGLLMTAKEMEELEQVAKDLVKNAEGKKK